MEARKRGDDDLEKYAKRINVNGLSDTQDAVEIKLYCVCRQAIEDDRVMIACDQCDEWFHTDCLQIPDDAVDRIDLFICPGCETRTQARTSYKPGCESDGCLNPARLPMSQYCSDVCGMRSIQKRAEAILKDSQSKKHLAMPIAMSTPLSGYVVWTRPSLAQDMPANESPSDWLTRIQSGLRSPATVPDPPAGQSLGEWVREHNTPLDNGYERNQWTAALAHIKKQSAHGHLMLDVLAVRGKLLQLAEDRQSVLSPAVSDLATNKGELDTHPRCGFDQRLIWSDEDLWEWAISAIGRKILQEEIPLDGVFIGQADTAGPQVICGDAKRRCKRHTDWSIVRGADIEIARELQTLHVSSLAEREQKLRSWLDTPT
ncbi:COMPASS (complex proteins associated with Set1p) component [Malassezia yamatoensis]|uniref:COMPASS (Complex proteins associated with Set1p) component n=1 Tax=Malassezia yamatoensis TaxID=253288 RepID=A0AAJ6CF22_9BASI|nr:COMPASS (complex proteins associated with Set1p) component [Malassezia yamatoensis]